MQYELFRDIAIFIALIVIIWLVSRNNRPAVIMPPGKNDPEHDLEAFDEGYIKGLQDYLLYRWNELNEHYSHEVSITRMTSIFYSVNRMDSVMKFGQFHVIKPTGSNHRHSIEFFPIRK